MSERKITIIEYHSHGDGPRLFPNLFDQDDEEQEKEESTSVSDDPDSGRGWAPFLVLGVLIAIAVGYRYFASDDASADIDTEQVEVTEYEA